MIISPRKFHWGELGPTSQRWPWVVNHPVGYSWFSPAGSSICWWVCSLQWSVHPDLGRTVGEIMTVLSENGVPPEWPSQWYVWLSLTIKLWYIWFPDKPIWSGKCPNVPNQFADCSHCQFYRENMGVSWNGGTSKSSIFMVFSIINHPWGGCPIYGNSLMVKAQFHIGFRHTCGWIQGHCPTWWTCMSNCCVSHPYPCIYIYTIPQINRQINN